MIIHPWKRYEATSDPQILYYLYTCNPKLQSNLFTSINMYSVGNKVWKESIYSENSEMLEDRQ